MSRFFSILVLLALVGSGPPAGAAATARATFAVHCYDVGAGALEHRQGVQKIERGWQGFHEVDRVQYDPQQVSREQLERWLRQAGTYIRTLDGQPKQKP